MDHHVSNASYKKHIKAFIIVVVLLIVIFGGIFGFSYFVNAQKADAMAHWKVQPVEVNATTAKISQWQPTIQATGDAVAIQSVNVTTQASGLVSSIAFDSGEMVKQGQLLFTLDTSELKAQLDQAKAKLALSKITYERDQDLLQKNMISQQETDQSKASYQADLANVAAIEANINYHLIKAPFSGKIGLRQISLGQYFEPGSSAATLTKISPIYINFPVPQNVIDKIDIGGEIKFTSDAYPGMNFTAKITAINSEITSDNRAMEVQATFDNKDKEHYIYPGMFLNVRVVLPVIDQVIVLPRNAISYTLYGQSVFVLEPTLKNGKPVMAEYSAFKDGKLQLISTGKPQYVVKQVPVTTTMTEDNKVIVAGIHAKDIVATSGQNKLQAGSVAIINNTYDFKNNP